MARHPAGQHRRPRSARRPRPAAPRLEAAGAQARLARHAGAELRVERDGVHRVSYEELTAAGIDLAGVAASDLALTSQGRSVPLRVEGPPSFGPGSFVEFVGRALDTLYTRTNLYTLEVDRRLGRRVELFPAGTPWARVPEVYTETTTVERDLYYLNVSPSDDPWWERRLLATSRPVATTSTSSSRDTSSAPRR